MAAKLAPASPVTPYTHKWRKWSMGLNPYLVWVRRQRNEVEMATFLQEVMMVQGLARGG